MAREKELDGVEMHHTLSQSFNGTPKIIWDEKAKKISKRAKKWQRKIEKHRKEVEPIWQYFICNIGNTFEVGVFELSDSKFSTYEEAFEEGLKRSLELIKK